MMHLYNRGLSQNIYHPVQLPGVHQLECNQPLNNSGKFLQEKQMHNYLLLKHINHF